ncbi:S8 family serine peptidase [Planomonospora sp. ID82291]|uniref:S8 family peptidase n=1 Tax=Planomonospora sp. ID82291 TaxID=2738136 RepID=UPI0018C40E1D|nr:S8 family serine peptidase [Planomonospora sp. ID82291]MBG0815287.1 S8 family serine peptidase [Planomonospora sp. ID82291]
MRLRAAVALAIVLTITPALPAVAEDPAAPAPAATGSPAVPAPATDGTPTDDEAPDAPADAPPAQDGTPAQDGAPAPEAPKLEDGLAADEDGTRVIVEVTAPAEAAPVAGAAEALPESEVVLRPPDTSFIVVEATGESLAALAADPRVVSVRRDRTYSPVSLASGLQVIGADKAHAAGTTGQGQTIAIVDTGVDADHPALGGRVVRQACFSATDGGARSLCPNGQAEDASADAETAACVHEGANLCDHGTHVAGIAHAVAPAADLVAVQVFSRISDCWEGETACLTAYESSLLLALDHVAALKDTVPGLVAVNLSLGGGMFDGACDAVPGLQAMRDRVETLRAKGVAVVAAAGNEGSAGAGAPGCFSGAVTVGATADDDRVPHWSNHGPGLDLFAPGVGVDSAVPGGGTQVYSGTSMAAPHVAGAFALLAQQDADDAPDALLGRLRAAGRPVSYGGASTPRIDLAVALNGGTPAPGITPPGPEEGTVPDDPSDGPADDPADDPRPDPSAGPRPAPGPQDPSPADPAPVPLPTVTVTVTVTATPAPAPAAPAARAVCTRGTAKQALTAARWAAELTRGRGDLPDGTLACYLRLVGKASTVFSEAVRASTLSAAHRVLTPAKRTKRAVLDRELLAAWLNWAHGAADLGAKTGGPGATDTVRGVLATAEKRRLAGTSPGGSASALRKQVNARRAA